LAEIYDRPVNHRSAILFSFSFSTVSSRKILTGSGNSWTLVAGDIGDNETQTASNALFSFSFLQIFISHWPLSLTRFSLASVFNVFPFF
jgi:hypothetical protein